MISSTFTLQYYEDQKQHARQSSLSCGKAFIRLKTLCTHLSEGCDKKWSSHSTFRRENLQKNWKRCWGKQSKQCVGEPWIVLTHQFASWHEMTILVLTYPTVVPFVIGLCLTWPSMAFSPTVITLSISCQHVLTYARVVPFNIWLCLPWPSVAFHLPPTTLNKIIIFPFPIHSYKTDAF